MAGAKRGRATIGEKYASVASPFAGLSEGICVAQGYTVPSGDRMLDLALAAARRDGHVRQPGAEELCSKRYGQAGMLWSTPPRSFAPTARCRVKP